MLVNKTLTWRAEFVPTYIFMYHSIVSVTLLVLGFQYVP